MNANIDMENTAGSMNEVNLRPVSVIRHKIRLRRKSGQRDLPKWVTLVINYKSQQLRFRGPERKENLVVPFQISQKGIVGSCKLRSGEIFTYRLEHGADFGIATWKTTGNRLKRDADDTEVYVQEDIGDLTLPPNEEFFSQ